MTPSRRLALRAVPVTGWALLFWAFYRWYTWRPVTSPALRRLVAADAFASIVLHTAQIPAAWKSPAGRERSRASTALLTLIFGATWWKTEPAVMENRS
ncbi:MAG: hypothetical protein QM774_10550 [Gordonia sp. (in: high G+C Gram-positive bacteria)]|uniref:hypothetical protein n=1 Tax=Gordonia sp. (in: high G+C Gram-positive bacteria) TaxID=84139 RepID=UPI0039E507F9